MEVRAARPGDEDAVRSVHERSVREIAADAYRAAIVEAWVSPADAVDGGEDGSDEEADKTEVDTTEGDATAADSNENETTVGASNRGDTGGDEPGRDDGQNSEIQPDDGRLFVAEVAVDVAGTGQSDHEDARGPAGTAAQSTSSRRIVGFGDVRFESPEYLQESADGGVRAVYVDPDHAGEGVGSALLERLEETAHDRGLDSLGLHASVNARGFYEERSYDPVSEITFEFGGEVEGPAVEMRKEL